jgi:DNA ligase (NAD+)
MYYFYNLEQNPLVRKLFLRDIFENQIIVFTGFRDKNLETLIIEGGGKVSTSVSGNTTLLIYADTTGSKYNEAIKRGITTMSKDDFIKSLK